MQLARAALLITSTAIASCTPLLDANPAQCESDADCTKRGAAFAVMVCSNESVCVPAPPSAPPALMACTSHQACSARLQQAGYCVDGTCQPLRTPQCTRVLPEGAPSQPNTALVGFLAALGESDKSYGEPQLDGAGLAVNEIDKNGGLGPTPGVAARRLAMLVCNQQPVADVMRHLLRLRVPAVIGASYSTTTTAALEQARATDTLVLSPAATAPNLGALDDDGVLWRTAPSDHFQAEALKGLYARVVETLRKQGVSRPKVAAVTRPSPPGGGLHDLLGRRGDARAGIRQPTDPIAFDLTVRYEADGATTAARWQENIGAAPREHALCCRHGPARRCGAARPQQARLVRGHALSPHAFRSDHHSDLEAPPHVSLS